MSRHPKILQRSFAGGEMSPEMFSRVDDIKYQAGAETLLNCIPRPTGTVARRSGTRLVRETRDASKIAHLLSFVFSPTQSVVIEGSRATIGGVEGGYFRFHINGGTLLYSQPDRFVPSLNASASNAFRACRTVSCSVASPMVVTLTAHGLLNGDQGQFISSGRTMPGGVTSFTTYYVRNKTANAFNLSTTLKGALLASTSHSGYNPVFFNFNRFRTNTSALQAIAISEHRVQNKDAVVITMWPDTLNPKVTFHKLGPFPQTNDLVSFTAAQVTNGYKVGLATTAKVAQQVMFVASDFGGTLPSNVVEGKLYWATAFEVPNKPGWTVSETFGGPALDLGTGGSGTVRLCAMPELTAGSLGAQGEFGCLTPYYAIANANDPNILKLEASIATGQVVAGGFSFSSIANGVGPFKVHRVYETGDIASYDDALGGIRNFYAQRTWHDPELEADRNLITLEMHNSSGSRSPGSAQRTSATQGAYWRELAGRSTGGAIAVSANEYIAGSDDLLLTAENGAHGFANGMPVAIVEGVAPDGVTLDTVYYVVSATTATFKIALTVGGTAIVAPTSASPRSGGLLVEGWVGFNTTTDKVDWPSHGLNNGDTVVFSEHTAFASVVAQAGITLGTVYYVREKTTDDFRVSASAAGALIDLTGSAGSRHAAIGNAIYEVPHDYSETELPRIVKTQSNDVMTLTSQDHPVTELRRLSSTKWETLEPEFVAAVAPPGVNSEVSIVQGEGIKITEAEIESTRHRFVTGVPDGQHSFVAGNPVYVEGLPTTGLGSLADGYYICTDPTGGGGENGKRIYLRSVESGDQVKHGGDKTGLDGRIRYSDHGTDRTQKYVVTAIDDNNEESAANDPLTVSNNVFDTGASNTIGWGASPTAVRYRVYKELEGLYGMIGETDELTYKDDNIGPDLGFSPPIPDTGLRKHARVTFNATADTVGWTAHGLSAGMPVVFKTGGQMPGIDEGKTYFVLNPGTDDFQIAASADSETVVNITGTDTGNHSVVAGNFPSTVTHFEGRRVFGGSRAFPQDIWMTASGTESDLTYSIPTVDSDRIKFRIAARERSAIRHLVPLSQLLLLSDSGELRLTPLNDDALTPSSISVRPQSFVGADYPEPSLVNNTVVFAAARGGHMRELAYSRDVLGYLTGDLSIRAAHLFDGFTIKDQAYAKAPLPVVWCVSSSGKLLGITYIPEENVGAWHQHTTAATGVFESVTVVPEGDEDAVYVVVKRTINSVTKRYIERFADEYRGDTADLPDAFFVDCGLTYDGASTTSIAGLDHLEGEAVSFLADGVAGTGTVSSGTLTLTTAAAKVHVGLNFTSKIKTVPLSMMRLDASGSGRQKNITQVWVRIFQSGAFKVGPTEAKLSPSLSPAAGVLADNLVQVTVPGSWDDDGQVFIQQDTPLPLTVSGLTIEVASGG